MSRPGKKIVTSYRRADSEGISGRIFDCLVQHYGNDSVFIDVDTKSASFHIRKSTSRTATRRLRPQRFQYQHMGADNLSQPTKVI